MEAQNDYNVFRVDQYNCPTYYGGTLMDNKLEQISHALQTLTDEIWLLAMISIHRSDSRIADEVVLPLKSIVALVEKYENEIYERKMEVAPNGTH